jgi:hypothetical protein
MHIIAQEEEQEPNLDDDSSDKKVDLETLISENSDPLILDLSSNRLKASDMLIVADTLRNNQVREESFVIENNQTENRRNLYDVPFFILFSIYVNIYLVIRTLDC